MILVLHVDDILPDSNDLCMIRETKGYLENNFDLKDIGGATFVIGRSFGVNCWDSDKPYDNRSINKGITTKGL